MTVGAYPLPVSNDSLPEAPLLFCDNQDKSESYPFLAEYEQLCPGGLDEVAVKENEQARVTKQPASSAVETAMSCGPGGNPKLRRPIELNWCYRYYPWLPSAYNIVSIVLTCSCKYHVNYSDCSAH